MAERLAEIGRGGDLVRDLLGLRQIFPESLARNEAFCTAVEEAVAAMHASGPRALIGDRHA
jgi:mannitol-1-phosphate/altronate dehydrogenase